MPLPISMTSWPLQEMQAKLIEDVSIELGQRVPPSHQFDTFMTEEVNGSPDVLPCFALSSPEQSIVKCSTLDAIKSMQKQVDSDLFSTSAAFLAVLSFECENVRLITAGTPWDDLFELLLLCSFVVFCLELVVRYAAEVGYCWSVWFPLDLLATLTLLMELHWFQDLVYSDDCNMFSPSHDHIAHVGGQAAHALRVARVLRILRFTRLVKLYRPISRLLAYLASPADLACKNEWFPAATSNFQHLLGKINQMYSSVAAEGSALIASGESNFHASFIQA